MDREKRRKRHLVIYGIAIPVSLWALYMFLIVLDIGTGWKVLLTIMGLGWLISAVSGWISNWRK